MRAAAIPDATDDLGAEDGGNFVFRWSEAAERFFREQRIFLFYPWKETSRFKTGQIVKIPISVKVERYANMPPGRFISAGAFSYCRTSDIANDFRLGRYCSVAQGVRLSDQQHPLERVSTHSFTFARHASEFAEQEFRKTVATHPYTLLGPPPEIGHDVWVGQGAILKRGVRIGHGAVIGERSIVTKDVPDYAIVAGSPATVKRFRFTEPMVERLLALEWWNYNFADFGSLDVTDIDRFASGLSEMVALGQIRRFDPGVVPLAVALRDYLEEQQINSPSDRRQRSGPTLTRIFRRFLGW